MKKLFVIALAAIGMAACTQEELVSIKGGDAIVFDDAFLDNATRAAADPSITTANIDGFNVWAFMDEVDGTVFEAEEVTKSGDAWTYANTQYWAPSHDYYFAALAPIGGNWTLNTANANKLGAGIVNFINVDGGEDLIYAKQFVSTPADINAQPAAVKLQFQHLLSKVKFTFKNGFANDNTKLVVKNIQMTAPQGGSIDLAVADYSKGWNLNGTDVAYAYGDLEKEIKGLDAKAESANERLMIPAAADHLYTITFDVDLYMGDVLAQTFPGRKTQIMGVELEMGKAYNFTATLTPQNIVDEESTLYPITFEVEVDEWDTQAPAGDQEVALNTYYVKTAAELAEALTSDAGVINVTLLENIDIAISTLGQQTGGSGEYKLGGKGTEALNIDLGGKTLNITTTYWSNLGAKNDNALFTIKNGTMTSSQATGTWNSYDLTFSNCNYVIEDVVFEKAIAFDNEGKQVDMKNVTINETHDYYAMWITAEGQTVNAENLTINNANGRGIKIDEQYVSAPSKVTLNIKDSKVTSNKKAAILVKSVAGAEINVDNLDITAVAEDKQFAVWVDEDAAAYANLVTVTGALCKVEGEKAAVAADDVDLIGALVNGDDLVVLGDDVNIDKANLSSNGYGATGITVNGQTLDGNGHVLDIQGAGGTWDSGINITSGTIKNITVTGAFRGIFIKKGNDKVILENVITKGTTYTVSCDSANYQGLEAYNSEFYGWTSFAATLGTAYFEGCTFGEGSGYAFAHPYAPTTFVNCDFEAGFCMDARAEVTFENCRLGGVELTSANIGDLVVSNVGNVKEVK